MRKTKHVNVFPRFSFRAFLCVLVLGGKKKNEKAKCFGTEKKHPPPWSRLKQLYQAYKNSMEPWDTHQAKVQPSGRARTLLLWTQRPSSRAHSTDKVRHHPPPSSTVRGVLTYTPVCMCHNETDGLRQYSLTPHPSMLPQDYLDQQRAESAVLLNKSLKSKIIRFVCLEIRLADGMPYSYTPKYVVSSASRRRKQDEVLQQSY